MMRTCGLYAPGLGTSGVFLWTW